MTDQQLALRAMSDAQRILEEYLARLRLRPTKRVDFVAPIAGS